MKSKQSAKTNKKPSSETKSNVDTLALFKKTLGMRIEKIGVLVEYTVSGYENCVLSIYNGVGLFA